MLYLSLSLSRSGYAEVLTASGVTIPLVCCMPRCMPRGGRAAEERHCLLFSHGNAEDLGETLPFLTVRVRVRVRANPRLTLTQG